MSLKVQKIRSLENAVYKDSYNRVRFQISADDLSTDMSESYLAMKLYIVNGLTGNAYTKEEILNLDKSKVMFSFGSALGEAYSPACLIKTARIFSMMGELSLLEEINYCNVLTQTLNQFAKDFESLSSESLMTMASTGSLMMSSVGAGCGSYFGAELSLSDQSVQVNIKLSEIFGICKTNNFHNNMGLQIELELEDQMPLIQQRVAVDLVNNLPTEFDVIEGGLKVGTTLGFSPDYSTNQRSIRVSSQNRFSNSANLLASSVQYIEKPEAYKYDSSYVQYVVPSALVDTANLVVGSYYQIQNLDFPTLTEANWTAMGAVAGEDGPDVDTAALIAGTTYEIKTIGSLTPMDWDVAGAAVNAGDAVATTVLTPANYYKIKTLGDLTPMDWDIAGAAINAGDAVDTAALIQNRYYKIKTLGTLTLANWNTAGWLGAVLPVVGDTFVCLAITVTGATCDTITDPVVGNTFLCVAPTPGGTGGTCDTISNPVVGSSFTALAPTITGATVFVNNTQKVGQKFQCIAVGPTGGKCYTVEESGKMKPAVGGYSDTIQFVDSIKWTTAQMDNLLMTVGKQIKMFWKITQPNHVPRFFQHINTITQRSAYSSLFGSKLGLSSSYIIPDFNGTHLQDAVIEFDHFEIVSDGLDLSVNTSNDKWENLQKNQLVEMTPAQVVELQTAGLLSGGTASQINSGLISELSGTSNMVCVACDQQTADPVAIYPDVYESADIPSLRKLYSNQSVKLPNQGGLVSMKKATLLANGNYHVTISGLGLDNNNSLQNSCMIKPAGSGLGDITPATSFNLHFWNAKESNQLQPASEMVKGQTYVIKNVGTTTQAQWVAAGNDNGLIPAVGQSFVCVEPLVNSKGDSLVSWVHSNKSNSSYKSPTWEITKAELVLIQTEKNDMPPASIYSTVKVEAVTIENEVAEYNRQFVVSEPNCFSAVLCAPLIRGGVSLVSHSANIQQYRWSVNNIDNTNRNIVIESNSSKFPSTLHIDKFLDTMNNDVSPVASLSGINGVSRSVMPPVVFPLKIYSSSDAESQYLNPLSGYTLQFAGYGDETHNKRIAPGPIYLFKYMFKTL